MPTYEYVCTNCENAWEEVQKISEDALKVCPKCHQETAKRQISGGNFILKGGGWYADLYSSTPKKSSGGEASGGSAPSTESKPAAAAPAAPAAPSAPSGGGGSSGGGSSGGGGDSK